MKTLEYVVAELRALNEPVPKPMRLPSESEVNAIEHEMGLTLHPQFRQYLLTASDVVCGVLEPVTVTIPNSHTHLPTVAREAGHWGVPKDLVPICHDNADYYCVASDGRVVFWSHDLQGPTGEEWPSIADWIKAVWIDESHDS